MRAIVHIGMSKAGSTALQDSLHQSHDILLEHGVLYPKNAEGVTLNNHRLLIGPLLDFEKHTRDIRRNCDGPEDLLQKSEALVEAIREQVLATAPSCLILSNEHLFRSFPQDRRALFQDMLDRMGVTEPQIVVYIRRPSDRYLSGLQQAFRMTGALVQPRNVNYSKPMSCFAEMFGAEALHPQILDRSCLSGESIATDFVEKFLSAEGVAHDALLPPRRTNNSVSAAGLHLLNLFVKDAAQGGDPGFSLQDLRRAIVQAEPLLDLPRLRLASDIADAVDYSSLEPLWLRDTYGLEFPNFDYARLEAGRTETFRGDYALEQLVQQPAEGDSSLAALCETIIAKKPGAPYAAWVAALMSNAGSGV